MASGYTRSIILPLESSSKPQISKGVAKEIGQIRTRSKFKAQSCDHLESRDMDFTITSGREEYDRHPYIHSRSMGPEKRYSNAVFPCSFCHLPRRDGNGAVYVRLLSFSRNQSTALDSNNPLLGSGQRKIDEHRSIVSVG